MKFGKRLLRQAHAEWASCYVDYGSLKQELKNAIISKDYEGGKWDFMLNQELEKVNKFYLEKETQLQTQLTHFEENSEQLATSTDFTDFCRIMELLRYYVVLNYMSVYKITKKRNKLLRTAKPINYLNVLMEQYFYNSLKLARMTVKTELLALRVIPGDVNEQNFQCPICWDVLCNPVVLSCTHRFCWRCLSKTSERMSCCPVCRKDQHLDPQNFGVDWILTEFLHQKFPQDNCVHAVHSQEREGLIEQLEKRASSLSCKTKPDDSTPTSQTTVKIAPTVEPKPAESKVQECKYTLLKRIGEGVFGEVYLAKHKEDPSGKQFALKKLSKNHPKFRRTSVFREVNAGKLLNHPGIVQLQENFETASSIYLVMEYFGGRDLFSRIEDRNYKPYSEPTSKEIFKQLVDSVIHCHQQGIAHRDIKLENILMDTNGLIKLIDFGLCDFVMDVGNRIRYCIDSVGSPAYISPEILTGKPYDGFKADIWSCGVVLYALLFGCFPFSPAQYKLLVNGEPLVVQFPESNVSQVAKDLIRAMLKPQPDIRITLDEIQNHNWVCDSIVAEMVT